MKFRIREIVQTYPLNIVEKYILEKMSGYNFEDIWDVFCRRHSPTEVPGFFISNPTGRAAANLSPEVEEMCYELMHRQLEDMSWVYVKESKNLQELKDYIDSVENAKKLKSEESIDSETVRVSRIVYP